MKTYNVLMTINEYIEVQANSAIEAEDTARKEYEEGKHVIDSHPLFLCEECDAEDYEDDEEDAE